MERNLKIWVVSRTQANVMKSADLKSPSILDKRARFSFLERLDVDHDEKIYLAARSRGAIDYDMIVHCPSFLLTISKVVKTTVMVMRPGESGIPLTVRQMEMVERARLIGEEA